MVKNLLTIDLEDWHQLAYRRITGDTPLAAETRLPANGPFAGTSGPAQNSRDLFCVGEFGGAIS